MQIRIGPPVSGESYFPRPKLEARVLRSVHGNHVSLLAPRRTGKTSLLTRLRDEAPVGALRPLVNPERFRDPASWMASMLQPLSEQKRWGKLGRAVRAAVETVEGIELTGAGRIQFRKDGWEGPAARVLKKLIALDSPITFLLDEFPVPVMSMARADLETCRSALHRFREWRQRTAEVPVRFLVTGSIGLEPIVKRYDLWDTVNDFTDVTFPPLSDDEACSLLRKLLAGIDLELNPSLLRYAIAKLNPPWPYFVQLLAGGLEEALDPTANVSQALIDHVYRGELVAGPRNKYTVHTWERLRRVFEDRERQLASAILRGAAFSDAGLTREQLGAIAAEAPVAAGEHDLSFVLEVLKHDGYLYQEARGEQRTRFFSNVLREYWVRKYS